MVVADLAEVARRAGVSGSTVSRALNRPDMVRPELVKRIRAIAEELGYSPNPFARSLRVRGSRTLGLIIPDNTNPFFAEVAKGIVAACSQAGYTLILCNSDRSLTKEAEQARVLHDKRVDGVLLFNVDDESADTVAWLLKRSLPVVVIERRPPRIGADCVLSDNAGGIASAVEHLYVLGHRDVALLNGDVRSSHYAQRLRAFEEAMASRGLPTPPEMVTGRLITYADGQRTAADLLRRAHPPTALLCATDTLAVGALRGAALAGKRVPEDAAIVGYGDIELASYTQPPLTSVVQDKPTVGAKAVRLLLRRAEQQKKGETWRPRVEIVPTRLAIRGSTDPAAPLPDGRAEAAARPEAAGARSGTPR